MKENNKGMSKIGKIIAIVVIIILVIIMIPSGKNTSKKNQTSKVTSNIGNIQKSGENEKVSGENILSGEQVLDENPITSEIKVGDYIKYKADTTVLHTKHSSLTGIPSSEGINITASDTESWRVWEKKSDGTIVIISCTPLNDGAFMGQTGFVNAKGVIEDICDLYANSKYGVTTEDVRSLTIEDLEEVSTDLVAIRDNYSNYGKTNTEINGDLGYTNGTFYTETDGTTINKDGIVAGETNPVVLKQTYYIANNPTWKSIENEKFPSETYGTLLGQYDNWLASSCTDLDSAGSKFYIRYANSNDVKAYSFCDSNGYSSSEVASSRCRPLVTLKPENLTNLSGDGSKEAPWTFEI